MDEHLLEVYLINTARHTEETPVAEWVSLPTDAETMKAVFERLGVDGSDTEQYQVSAFHSSLDGWSEALKPGESLDDLNYLAALLTQRSNEERDKFAAAAQYGDHAASAADLINLTHNLDCYWLYPTVHNSDDYGHYLIDDLDELELPDAAKRFFDYKSYGREGVKEDRGIFTDYGYVYNNGNDYAEWYKASQVPQEYCLTAQPSPQRDMDELPQGAALPAEPIPVRPLVLNATDTQGRIKEITEHLEQGVQEVFESERYRDYLKAMSRFHNYSLNNTLLIVMQKPDASLVAGYGKWRDEFERHVKSGEKGIKILAPAPYKIKKDVAKTDPDTGQPVIGADGKPVTEQREVTIPAFKVVSVFDVSQTEGKELPDIAVDALTGNVEQYEDFWRALKLTSPVPVTLEKIDGSAHGYYDLAEKRIAIVDGMSELQTIKTAIHEIAHAKLHDIDLNAPEQAERPDRSTREVQAESVAYTVCQHFGLDTSDYSFGYVAGWSSGRDIKELKASLETIRTAASELISEIEGHFAELQAQHTAEQEQAAAQDIPENTFSIYQLKEGDATRDLRFEPLEQVTAAGLRVDRENYELVYTAPLSDTDTLEDIFIRFNMDRPQDFTGHSLSMSDVIVLHRGEQETAHYLDRGGYTEVPEFLQPEQTAQQEAQADAPPAERPLTELQKQAVEIAKQYETLSMQEKIGVIAQAFGCTSGTIETSPCTGKWRGTSDISIRFDNGSSLFLGNHMTRKAKTKKVQQELVDSALVRYNPEIIRVAKETAYTALKERELQDNAIAGEKGLKPYTLLNVEFNDGTDQQSSGYIGWYYATLAVDGKICTHLETGLNHDIASGSVSPTPTRENYYAAGALKESDVDYVFNNVGFSSASDLYSLHLSDAARGRAELELAKKLIDDYCREEFHSGADFSDLSAVGIGHTTVTDDEIPIQAYANLADFRIEKYLGDVLIESRQYESLAALIQGELNDLEFGDLTYASDEQIAMFHAQEEVSGKEATSLNPAVQPVVTILWSESDKLQEGEQLPLARADALFKALDDEKRSEREKPGYTGGWYDKTKFRIDCTFHGERDSYEGRQDFGDGDGALIDHIQAYHEYYAKDESWKNFVLHNEGAEAWEKDKAERATLLTEFVPYMRLHCNLSEQERTAADMLENGENLTPEQTAYFHAVIAHVDACREKLNAGDYHLPDPPQLSDFDKELQDYKAHVESEIAQEAEAAGMTVEEYAANGYEPQEQPADVQEQPEKAPPADTAPEQTAVRYYTINEGAARRANDANSYRDYAAGSATAEYRQMVDQAAAIAQRQKERVDPMYHEKIDALLDTYARKLAENLNDHYAIEARVPSILVAGGSNFPVRKKEKQNAARDRNMQEWQDVQGILDKIRSTGMGGISMDDPQAAAKLEAKLVKLESAQETMKAVNAYFRKNKTLEGCPSLTPEQITKLQQEMAQSWHLDKSRPYPAYMLSNNNAEIRRIRGRIEQVRQHEDTNFAGWEFDGGRVEANKADNRLQVFFDGKPDEAARDELKANGFRWAPSVGAWQRQLNKNAYYAAGYISCIQPISGEKPIDVQRSAQQQESVAPNTHLTGERVSTPRGSFHVADMTREQMEAAGYGYHHSTDDGKYLIMGNGTQAFAIAAEQREQENYMRTAELSTEQNYNMIDGQINNTPSVDELEEKAKRGEVISLSALAAAVKAEDGRTPQRDPDGKKPSIRAQLKADRAQSCKPQQREKEQEAKRSIRQALEME